MGIRVNFKGTHDLTFSHSDLNQGNSSPLPYDFYGITADFSYSSDSGSVAILKSTSTTHSIVFSSFSARGNAYGIWAFPQKAEDKIEFDQVKIIFKEIKAFSSASGIASPVVSLKNKTDITFEKIASNQYARGLEMSGNFSNSSVTFNDIEGSDVSGLIANEKRPSDGGLKIDNSSTIDFKTIQGNLAIGFNSNGYDSSLKIDSSSKILFGQVIGGHTAIGFSHSYGEGGNVYSLENPLPSPFEISTFQFQFESIQSSDGRAIGFSNDSSNVEFNGLSIGMTKISSTNGYATGFYSSTTPFSTAQNYSSTTINGSLISISEISSANGYASGFLSGAYTNEKISGSGKIEFSKISGENAFGFLSNQLSSGSTFDFQGHKSKPLSGETQNISVDFALIEGTQRAAGIGYYLANFNELKLNKTSMIFEEIKAPRAYGVLAQQNKQDTFVLGEAGTLSFKKISGSSASYGIYLDESRVMFTGNQSQVVYFEKIKGGANNYPIYLLDSSSRLSFENVELRYGMNAEANANNIRAGIYASTIDKEIIKYRLGNQTLITTDKNIFDNDISSQTRFLLQGNSRVSDTYGIYLSGAGKVVFENSGGVNVINMRGSSGGIAKVFSNNGGEVEFERNVTLANGELDKRDYLVYGVYNSNGAAEYHFGTKTTFDEVSNPAGDAIGLYHKTGTLTLDGKLIFNKISSNQESYVLKNSGTLTFGAGASLQYGTVASNEAGAVITHSSSSGKYIYDFGKSVSFTPKPIIDIQSGDVEFRGELFKNGSGEKVTLLLGNNSQVIFNIPQAGIIGTLKGSNARVNLAGDQARGGTGFRNLTISDMQLSNSIFTLFANPNSTSKVRSFSDTETRNKKGESDKIIITGVGSSITTPINNTLELKLNEINKTPSYVVLAEVGSGIKDKVIFNNLRSNGEQGIVKSYVGFEVQDIGIARLDDPDKTYYYTNLVSGVGGGSQGGGSNQGSGSQGGGSIGGGGSNGGSQEGVALNYDFVNPAASLLSNHFYLMLGNLDSLNQRMGELRGSEDKNGAWGRVFFGSQSLKVGTKSQSQYTTLQFGYDYNLGSEGNNNYLGLAFSYINSKNTQDSTRYNQGLGFLIEDENSSNTNGINVALYNTFIQESFYSDSVLRASYLSSDVYALKSNYNISNYSFGISEEVGYRQKLGEKKEWILTPQIGLDYLYINSSSINLKLKNKSLLATQDAISLARARLGVDWRYDLSPMLEHIKASVYVGTYYAYEYILGGSGVLSENAGKLRIQTQHTDTTFQKIQSDDKILLNLGANIQIKDSVAFYFDMERSFLGKQSNIDYQVNFGVRYSFGSKAVEHKEVEKEGETQTPLKVDELDQEMQETKGEKS